MKKKIFFCLILFITMEIMTWAQTTPFKVLIFSGCTGYIHSAIPSQIADIQKICDANNIQYDATADGSLFTDSNLAQYKAAIFVSTTMDPTKPNLLSANQMAAFQRFIESGKGFVGIHAAKYVGRFNRI